MIHNVTKCHWTFYYNVNKKLNDTQNIKIFVSISAISRWITIMLLLLPMFCPC